MFIGHFAVGLAAKKFAPRTSLPVLLAAPLSSGILWPFFLLLGCEHVRIVPDITRYNPLDLYDFPWSHSLLVSMVWDLSPPHTLSTRHHRHLDWRGQPLVSGLD